MILLELFKADKTTEFDVIKDTSTAWLVRHILADGRKLEFEAVDSRDGTWDVSFTVDGSFDKTGGGSEIAIFSAVMSLLQAFTKSKSPKAMAMLSKGASRTSLYRKLFKRLNPSWIQILIPIGDDETVIFTGREAPKVREISGDYGFLIGFEFYGYEADGTESDALSNVSEKDRGDIKELLATAEELRVKHASK